MAVLQASAQVADGWDILASTQGIPLMCGRVDVMHRKFTVTYRVAGGLVFLLVTGPSANAFGCVQLLGQVVRVVTVAAAEGKALEVTPDRLERRFGEVFLAVDALLGSGGVLDSAAALTRAHATLDNLQDKDRGDKGGKGAPEPPKTPPQRAGGRVTRRTLQGAIDQLALLSFSTGAAMQRAVPRPGFALPDGAAAAAGPQAAARGHLPGQDPFALQGPAAPVQSAQSADPFGDDDIFGFGNGAAKKAPAPAAKPAAADPFPDPFAASDPFAPAAPAPGSEAAKPPAGDWTSFDGAAAAKGPAAAGPKATATGFEGNAFGDSAFPAPPPPVVPAEPVLRLSEVWRGEVAGGCLRRCGLSGRVEWVSEAAKAKVHTVQFMMQVPDVAAEQLSAALTAARRHPACCRPGPSAGVLLADGIQSKPHPGAPLLTYHLPPGACRPPLQVHLGASSQLTQDGRRLLTLGLHYAVSPQLAERSADLEVELHVPAMLGPPLRVSPDGAAFDARACSLRWQRPGPLASLDRTGAAAEPLVACFLVAPGSEDDAGAVDEMLRGRVRAVVGLRGVEGAGSVSGAGLAQGVLQLEATPALVGWRAEVTATL
ncbi:hypothetical protein GPECTOR_56g367 [Gonium pectorale]|uniref:MHD domain-containing protein n=1 Tax=Gonium pectorale TaxID=33097 RepID=A0A150G613_GONPE|nr:hypothetical protein GPECTOR_56g367 [Gonium pectorale]|eukprot:KXZ45271.1 hypothetical protein GPECTOR_56g367 [Gonium pectorale]